MSSPLVCREVALFEELYGRTALHSSVFDLSLLSEILGIVNGRLQTIGGQEGSQIRSVRRKHDERKEPPHSGDDASGGAPEEIKKIAMKFKKQT
jgi:hypothetical protein